MEFFKKYFVRAFNIKMMLTPERQNLQMDILFWPIDMECFV